MTSFHPFDTSTIPASATSTVIEPGPPVLVWVAAGHASVTLEATRWSLETGQALWIPGGLGGVARGAAGSCVVPIRVREADRAAGPSAPFLAPVPPPAARALLAAFTRSLGVLHGGGVRAAAVLHWIGHPTATIAVPALPTSPVLRRAAEALLTDPTRSPATVGAANGLSESTLARSFREETGWTPLRWRTRHLLGRAAEQLSAGRSVAATAAEAGYTSSQAFARAFRREWGMAPTEAASGAGDGTPLKHRVAELGPQCNGYHIVIWVAAGTATMDVDGKTIRLGTGDIACLPAGATVGFRAEADAAVVPLGWLPGGMDVAGGAIAHVTAEHRDPLLRLAAWAYAAVEPVAGGDPRLVLQAALGLPDAATAAPDVTDAAYALLDRLAEQPDDGRSIVELAAQIGISSDALRDAIETLTGTTLASWRARARMSWARRLLRDGMHAAQVADRIGYADAAAFSRAFRRAHGQSPAQFQAAQRRAAPADRREAPPTKPSGSTHVRGGRPRHGAQDELISTG